MVKAQSIVWKYFKNEYKNGKKMHSFCNFCNQTFRPNATKMGHHLGNTCKRVPKEIKLRFHSSQSSAQPKCNDPSIDSDDEDIKPCRYIKKQQHRHTEVANDGDHDHQDLVLESDESTAGGGPTCTRKSADDQSLHQESSAAPSSASTSSACKSDTKPKVQAPHTKQSTLADHYASFVDRISDKEHEEIEQAVARAVYATNSSLSMFESKYWVEEFHLLRPTFSTPSRWKLNHTLLDNEYNRVAKVDERITAATSVTLISDGWTNMRGESIVNFLLCTPQPVFYRSICTEESRHTGEYIASQLSSVIQEVGAEKVFAVMTDNARNMKAAWDILKQKYPNLITAGCSAHGINLLLCDIMKLKTMQQLTTKAKELVKYIKRTHIVLAVYKRKMQAFICSRKSKDSVHACSLTLITMSNSLGWCCFDVSKPVILKTSYTGNSSG
jgi:hypothetical protein